MKKITLIGIGSLGSVIAKHISETDFVDGLILVDFDIVESKNIHNSIYSASHIGERKVDALSEIIGDSIHSTLLFEKYKEGKTKLPKCDLVIDCRDVVCNRGSEIDAKLYISGDSLIIDCRNNIKMQYNYNGSYRRQLTKGELNKAGFFAAQVICGNEISYMKKNQTVQRLDLNLLPAIINKSIKRTGENKIDIIYDKCETERLYCIEENIKPILKLNKTCDIPIYIGDKNSYFTESYPHFKKMDYSIIPKQKLRNTNDLICILSEIVKNQNNILNFIITLRKDEHDQVYIELLEETGAA